MRALPPARDVLAEVRTKLLGGGAILSAHGLMLCRRAAATCYLNSWLQTLFNLNVFRQVVVRMKAARQGSAPPPIAGDCDDLIGGRDLDGLNACVRSVQAVYHIPTSEEPEPTKSIALALQTLFYQVPGALRAAAVMVVGLLCSGSISPGGSH